MSTADDGNIKKKIICLTLVSIEKSNCILLSGNISEDRKTLESITYSLFNN